MNLLGENKEYLENEISQAEENIRLAKEKIKSIKNKPVKGVLGAIKSFFSESIEELENIISESETLIVENRKKIKAADSLNKNKNKQVKKSIALKKLKQVHIQKFLKTHRGDIIFISGTLLITVIILINFNFLSHYLCFEEFFQGGDAMLSCIDIESDEQNSYLYFKMKHSLETDAFCYLQFNVGSGESLSTQEYNLGNLKSSKTRLYKVEIDLPNGISNISLSASCE